MTIQQHASAVLALLQADAGPPALVVFDGFVPAATEPPYVVVYFSLLSPENDFASSNLSFDSRREDCWIYCHSVGANAAAARCRGSPRTRGPARRDSHPSPVRVGVSDPARREPASGARRNHRTFSSWTRSMSIRLSSVPAT
jgi:hypothetical protein